MLVYVRESDIDKVMIKTQIPQKLEEMFTNEREMKMKIAREYQIWRGDEYFDCHIMTEETVINIKWNGVMIAQRF